MMEVEKLRQHAEDFLTQTGEARTTSERCRDYVNNKQWTREEESVLKARNQAPIVVNRVAPKIEGLKGLLIQRRTDPKAFPRTQKHAKAAEAVTDGLRYVADNTDFDETKLEVADEFFVEGYSGAIVEVRETAKEPEITIRHIPWDRLYYDPHSRRNDFSDARYMGMLVWMDLDAAKEKFGDVVENLTTDTNEGETFDDRPRWSETENGRKRIRIAQEYYREGGKWQMAIFSGNTFLKDPDESPYVDENDEPVNPIELVSGHADRDNARFGEVLYWLCLQDEINHRRSKALHLLSVRQTKGRKGAIPDVAAMKRELAKANGHVEIDGETDDFGLIPTGDMAQAQFNLLQEAKNEIDAVGYNAQLAGERQGNLSGKAIRALQAGGSNEVSSQFALLNAWERRIYRQIWYRIRQFWTREKWVRVTDDERQLRWVGFNVPITLQQQLEETINDESLSEFERRAAASQFASMMQNQDPRLQEMVETRNKVAELDVDIILEQALDTINIQQEQFELLANLAANRPEIPFTALLRLSTLRDKDDLIKKIEEGEKNAAALKQQEAKLADEAEQRKMQRELEADLILGKQKIAAKERELAIEVKAEEQKMMLAKMLDTNRAELAQHAETVIRIPDAQGIVAAMDNLAEASRDDSAIEELVAALERPRTVQRDDEGRIVGLA